MGGKWQFVGLSGIRKNCLRGLPSRAVPEGHLRGRILIKMTMAAETPWHPMLMT